MTVAPSLDGFKVYVIEESLYAHTKPHFCATLTSLFQRLLTLL